MVKAGERAGLYCGICMGRRRELRGKMGWSAMVSSATVKAIIQTWQDGICTECDVPFPQLSSL